MWTREYVDRREIIQALATIRQEWEEAADGKPLELVEGSVGMILDDVMHAVGLDQEKTITSQPIAD